MCKQIYPMFLAIASLFAVAFAAIASMDAVAVASGENACSDGPSSPGCDQNDAEEEGWSLLQTSRKHKGLTRPARHSSSLEAWQSWDSMLQEYMIDQGHCSAAALAQQTDGWIYAAAPTADWAGWDMVFKDPHEEKIMQEDGSEKEVVMDEAVQVKSLMDNLKTPDGGLWLGGTEYKGLQCKAEYEMGDGQGLCKWCFGGVPKGVHIITTATQILYGLYDEEKGQSSGDCKKSVFGLGVYLLGEGY